MPLHWPIRVVGGAAEGRPAIGHTFRCGAEAAVHTSTASGRNSHTWIRGGIGREEGGKDAGVCADLLESKSYTCVTLSRSSHTFIHMCGISHTYPHFCNSQGEPRGASFASARSCASFATAHSASTLSTPLGGAGVSGAQDGFLGAGRRLLTRLGVLWGARDG